MQSKWDEEGRRVVHATGAHTYVPYLGTAAQVSRWTAAGFDLQAAAARTDAFVGRFQAAQDFDAAEVLLLDHVAEEKRIAVEQGVDAGDPDLYRIEASVRAYQYEPA